MTDMSICIPIYNRDMRETVARLVRQAAEVAEEALCDVVCIDDFSEDNYREANRSLSDCCQYIELENNVGRSRIRNMFLNHTHSTWLLFLDCDAVVPDGFVGRYVQTLKNADHMMVICGGRDYSPESDDRGHHLRYRYGVECESRRADERCKQPYRSFMTNNFAVRREILEQIPFDEHISRYGHEDTLFGYRLKQNRVKIGHIDNPITNGDVEPNEEFLRKTQEGVRSLADICRRTGWDEGFVSQVALLQFYSKVRKIKADRVVLMLFKLLKPWLEQGFISGCRTNMKLFAFYKLGLFVDEVSTF